MLMVVMVVMMHECARACVPSSAALHAVPMAVCGLLTALLAHRWGRQGWQLVPLL